ncbi:MAG: hypothetical protein EPO39_18540 [Candidatus Manganitrophaceae bacterium]|nr:MAG: hypothetical protein EPO39_18540 [Candidatus Manganitrophaceae bacterium]
MTPNIVLRGFVTSAVVTLAVGTPVFRLLPGWSGLVSELGESGAWTLLIVSHLIYSLVIGLATYLFLTILEKFNYQGSLFGAGLSAAITVTIVNVATVWYSIDFGGALVFSLWVAWMALMVHFIVFLAITLLHKQRRPKMP